MAGEVQKLANLSYGLWQSAEMEVDSLKSAANVRGQLLATIITNLKHGGTPEAILEWWDREGRSALEDHPVDPTPPSTGGSE